MSLLSQIRALGRTLVGRRRAERETGEEIRFHLEMAAAQLEREGVPALEAHRRAKVAFGAVAGVEDDVRDARGWVWLDDLSRDARYAVRQLRRTPAFTFAAVATLAIGIGATTAIVTVVDGVLLRPTPFADIDRLVVVWETDRASGTTREPASWPDYLDFRERARSLVASAGLIAGHLTLSVDGRDPLRLTGVAATASFLDVVQVRPMLGRAFTPDEDRPGGPRVALLGETLWRTRFNADPGIIGRTIRLDEQPVQVIGVMPARTDFALDQIHAQAAYHAPYSSAGEVDVWQPLAVSAEQLPRSTHPLLIIGRLAPGATLEAAQEELASIAADLEDQYPENEARGVHVEALTAVAFGPTRSLLWLLLGAVTLLLAVACVNVANLLLARGAARAREVAMRTALGAARARLGKQFVVESLLLSLLGAVGGVALAVAALRVLRALAPSDLPRINEVGIDARVLLLTMGITVAVGVLFGLVPMLQALRVDTLGTLRGESASHSATRKRTRAREALIVAEFALSVSLAVCAGLLIQSFRHALGVDPGFSAQSVLKAEYQLPAQRYPRDFSRFPNWTEITRFNSDVLNRVRAIPGVEQAAIAAAHPLDQGFTNSFSIVGREAESQNWPEISVRAVSDGYFETLQVRLREGRLFAPADDGAGPSVALINATAKRMFFGDRNPIGEQIQFWGIPRQIVGVVADEHIKGVTSAAPPATYVPVAQMPPPGGALLLRTSIDPTNLAGAVREAIAAVDPQLAVYGVEPLTTTLLESEGERRFAMLVLSVFAGAAVILALVGIHGVVSYATAQRTREIGIRVALGASPQSVLGMVVAGGVGLAAVGAVLGIAGAVAGSRFLAGFLFGVTRLDVATYGAVAVAVLVAAAVSTWLPARRAARVAPVVALRVE